MSRPFYLGLCVSLLFCSSCKANQQCPKGYSVDPTRVQRILRLLDTAPKVKVWAKVRTIHQPLLCFGQGMPQTVDSYGVMYLLISASPEQHAAKFLHLLQHLHSRHRFHASQPCKEQVTTLLHEESKAWSLELQVLSFLLPKRWVSLYPFAPFLQEFPKKQWSRKLFQMFQAYPRGWKGLPGLKHAYEFRCRRMSKAP